MQAVVQLDARKFNAASDAGQGFFCAAVENCRMLSTTKGHPPSGCGPDASWALELSGHMS